MKDNRILFDFLESISYSKIDIMTCDNEKYYDKFLIEHFLSNDIDTVFFVNEISQYSNLSKRIHYDFLRLGIEKRKRKFIYIKSENKTK